MAKLRNPIPKLKGKDRAIYLRMLARRQAKGVGLYGPYEALLYNPELAELIEKLGFYLKFRSTLPRDIYQFIVLYMSRINNIAFEWKDHILPARRSGLPETIITLLRANKFSQLPQPYLCLHKALCKIMRFKSLPKKEQTRLIRLYGDRGLIEIVVLSGFYALIGQVNTSFNIKHR